MNSIAMNDVRFISSYHFVKALSGLLHWFLKLILQGTINLLILYLWELRLQDGR